jgi:hypothetical protein
MDRRVHCGILPKLRQTAIAAEVEGDPIVLLDMLRGRRIHGNSADGIREPGVRRDRRCEIAC